MAVLMRRGSKVSLVLAAFALAATGCVFEDSCVGGAVRDEGTGRCVLDGADGGGRDAAAGDAGRTDGGGGGGDASIDAGPPAGDAGVDGGAPPTIADFAVGAAAACAIDDLGTLRCWGANAYGALATGDVSPQPSPVVVDLGASVTGISTQTIHVCATTAAPAAFCWGTDEVGQIGDGTASADLTTTPFELTGLGSLRQLATGFANTCSVSLLGGARCWGRNDSGQLGLGTSGTDTAMPTDPVMESAGMDLEEIGQAAVGDRHICFRVQGRALCVGDNGHGQLGDGTTTNQPFPVAASGLTMVTDLAAAFSHTCAIDDGDVYCWGEGESGQVVPGATGDFNTPQLVDLGGAQAIDVATGQDHVCVALSTGTVRCWGSDEFGQLGDLAEHTVGTFVGPVDVEGLSGVTQIEASSVHLTCALTMDGELWCWGQDASEELGGAPPGGNTVYLDRSTNHPTPVRVDPFM